MLKKVAVTRRFPVNATKLMTEVIVINSVETSREQDVNSVELFMLIRLRKHVPMQ